MLRFRSPLSALLLLGLLASSVGLASGAALPPEAPPYTMAKLGVPATTASSGPCLDVAGIVVESCRCTIDGGAVGGGGVVVCEIGPCGIHERHPNASAGCDLPPPPPLPPPPCIVIDQNGIRDCPPPPCREGDPSCCDGVPSDEPCCTPGDPSCDPCGTAPYCCDGMPSDDPCTCEGNETCNPCMMAYCCDGQPSNDPCPDPCDGAKYCCDGVPSDEPCRDPCEGAKYCCDGVPSDEPCRDPCEGAKYCCDGVPSDVECVCEPADSYECCKRESTPEECCTRYQADECDPCRDPGVLDPVLPLGCCPEIPSACCDLIDLPFDNIEIAKPALLCEPCYIPLTNAPGLPPCTPCLDDAQYCCTGLLPDCQPCPPEITQLLRACCYVDPASGSVTCVADPCSVAARPPELALHCVPGPCAIAGQPPHAALRCVVGPCAIDLNGDTRRIDCGDPCGSVHNCTTIPCKVAPLACQEPCVTAPELCEDPCTLVPRACDDPCTVAPVICQDLCKTVPRACQDPCTIIDCDIDPCERMPELCGPPCLDPRECTDLCDNMRYLCCDDPRDCMPDPCGGIVTCDIDPAAVCERTTLCDRLPCFGDVCPVGASRAQPWRADAERAAEVSARA